MTFTKNEFRVGNQFFTYVVQSVMILNFDRIENDESHVLIIIFVIRKGKHFFNWNANILLHYKHLSTLNMNPVKIWIQRNKNAKNLLVDLFVMKGFDDILEKFIQRNFASPFASRMMQELRAAHTIFPFTFIDLKMSCDWTDILKSSLEFGTQDETGIFGRAAIC